MLMLFMLLFEAAGQKLTANLFQKVCTEWLL